MSNIDNDYQFCKGCFLWIEKSMIHNSGGVMTDAKQFCARVCGCGVVHLSFGVATINVSPEVMGYIAETLSTASEEMKRMEFPSPAKEVATIDSIGNIVHGSFKGNKNDLQ